MVENKIEITGTIMANINQCWIIENDFGHFDIGTDFDFNVGDPVKLSMAETSDSVALTIKNMYIDPLLSNAKIVFENAFFNINIQELLNHKSGIELYNLLNKDLFSLNEGDTTRWVVTREEVTSVN